MAGGYAQGRMQPHQQSGSGMGRYGAAFNPYMPRAYTPQTYAPQQLAPERKFTITPSGYSPSAGLTAAYGGGGDAGMAPSSGGLDTSTGVPGQIGAFAPAMGLSMLGVPPGITTAAINGLNAMNAAQATSNAEQGIGLSFGMTPSADAFGPDSPAFGIAPSAGGGDSQGFGFGGVGMGESGEAGTGPSGGFGGVSAGHGMDGGFGEAQGFGQGMGDSGDSGGGGGGK